MEDMEWTFPDLKLPPGPWRDEPDKMQWTDQCTGLPCLIVRNSSGALCGYVGVPPEHPWFGVWYSDVDADVHGGLTFSATCSPAGEADPGGPHVCHLTAPDEPPVWWQGFDCAHMGDVLPRRMWGVTLFETHATYRGIDYVRAECTKLARQAREAAA